MTRDKDEVINREFFKKRFDSAWEYRKTVIDTSSCRFIFGEADLDVYKRQIPVPSVNVT